ncbi:MAG: helix-turn-helix domain-containing protein [Acidimicrobiales bacterium]
MPGDLMSIGEMSRRCGLTVKAMRYYDRVGLLRPAVVDDATSFRYYSTDQIPAGRVVGRLRSIDVPLDDIRRCLESPDQATALHEILLAHRRRLESRATRIAGDLHDLMHVLSDGLETTVTNQPTDELLSPEQERKLGAAYFNSVWDLMEKEDRTTEEDDLMLHMAHASRHHWGQVGKPEQIARGEWQVSRVYAVLHRSEPCLHHAQRVLDICLANGIADWDLAFAYEALARGHAVAGDPEAARAMTERALEAVEQIAEDEDRKLVLADLETIPAQKRFW